MRALKIIESWISFATGKPEFLKHFWNARDVLEQKYNVPEAQRKNAIAFIRDTCKPSPDRDELLRELYRLS